MVLSYFFTMANHHDLTRLCYNVLFILPCIMTTLSTCKNLRAFFMKSYSSIN
jgi:hypothetical protein